MSSRRSFVVVFVLLAGALALHAWRYFPFLTDETLVTLRYASRFASGHGLTFSDGERVEGYTNFLFVVLNGCLQRIGVDAIGGARALGFVGVLLAIACVGLEPRRRGVFLPRLAVGGILLVATAPVVIWSVGGLESGLVAGLVALSFRLLERAAFSSDARRPWLAGLPPALLVLVRADGVLLALALLAGSACLPRPSAASVRRAAFQAIPSAVAWAFALVFRLAYYGDWLPSPARQSEPGRFSNGLDAAGSGYGAASMLILLAAAATVFTYRRGERLRLVMPWAVVAAATLCVIAGGANPLPGHRGLVVALTALCFVAADEIGDDWSRIAKERVLVVPILALSVFLHATQSSETADSRRAREERGVWHGLAVGRTLGRAFAAEHPLLAVNTPGALAFAADVSTLDLGGMHGEAPSGPAEVVRRAPDLVVFGAGAGTSEPKSTSGLELARSRRFLDVYQWISVDGTPRSSDVGEIWLRRERGKLGVVRSRDRIEIPGYLFTGQASRASSVVERGVLVAELSAPAPGIVPELDVPAGRYRLSLVPGDAKAAVDLRCRDVSMRRVEASNELVFEVDGKAPVSIAVAPAPDARSLKLRRVTLSRVSDTPPALRCVPRGRALEVLAASVRQPKSSKNLWNHPSNVSFSSEGLVVAAGELEAVAGVELSLSHNNAYVVELRLEKRAVWSTGVEANRKAKRPALVTHRFELPKRLDERGSYDLFIKPRRGDSPSTLGHAVLF